MRSVSTKEMKEVVGGWTIVGECPTCHSKRYYNYYELIGLAIALAKRDAFINSCQLSHIRTEMGE